VIDGWTRRLLSALTVTISLCACSEEQTTPTYPPRALKYVTVEERAGTQVRRIAGVTEAGIVTEIGFEVGGKLIELKPDLGESVRAGELLARLDPEPYQLRLLTAQGQLDEAEARAAEAQSKFDRISGLFKKSYASQSEYDSALTDLERARANVQVARTQKELAERDLQKTSLTSPLVGLVTAKYVEQFADLTPGKPVLQISSEGRLKVKAAVPQSLVGNLGLGDEVAVYVPTVPPVVLPGRITEIGTRASATSTFPVTAVLSESDTALRPGTTVDVEFSFATAATGQAFMLPIAAVLPTGEQGAGAIFVFDRDSGKVHRRTVEILNVRGNRLEVAGEIRPGDIVAAAGVPFLYDGMTVRLLDEAPATRG